jgi:hypothetical protein
MLLNRNLLILEGGVERGRSGEVELAKALKGQEG